MEPLTVSNETFQQALCWINGEESSLKEKEVKDLLESLTGGFRNAFRRLHPDHHPPRMRTLVPHPLSLSSLMGEEAYQLMQKAETERRKAEEEEKKRNESAAQAEPSAPKTAGLDSVTLLNAIGYVSMRSGIRMTQSRAQIILYCLYGNRLGAGNERLEIEHPQMWKYGPVFPRAYKRSNLDDMKTCETSYRELSASFPDLLSRLESKTTSMMGTAMCDLNAVHKGEKSPYGKLLRKNPSKWGLQIPDEDIAKFFKENSR